MIDYSLVNLQIPIKPQSGCQCLTFGVHLSKMAIYLNTLHYNCNSYIAE